MNSATCGLDLVDPNNPPRWVLRRYSFGYEHITKEWVDTMIARGRATQISANLI